MRLLLTALVLVAGASAAPRRPTPSPTVPLPPPPSSFPSSVPGAPPAPSDAYYTPPQPSGPLPYHYGGFNSTALWLSTPQGAPLYNMCVDTSGCRVGPGAKVVINKCNGAESQNWAFAWDSTTVRPADSDLCMDAGKDPQSGSKVRLARCDGSPSQQWFTANTGLIILHDRTENYLCLDITGGSRAPGTQLQVYPCALNNGNQDFYPSVCWDHICIA